MVGSVGGRRPEKHPRPGVGKNRPWWWLRFKEPRPTYSWVTVKANVSPNYPKRVGLVVSRLQQKPASYYTCKNYIAEHDLEVR